MGLKKVTLKCGKKEVVVLKSVANAAGVRDGQEVSEAKLQEVVTRNADYMSKVTYSNTPGRFF